MSAKVPQIVASQDFLNQTAALAATTLFTPSADGTFRVSVYIDVDSGANPSFIVFGTVSWTDDEGNQSQGMTSASAGGFTSQSFIVRAKSGNAIKVAAAGGANIAQPYNLYAVVESLEP